MARTYTLNLSVSSINKLADDFEAYRNGLPDKCRKLVTKLSLLGIRTAQQNVGKFGKYIVFSMGIRDGFQRGARCKGVLVATNNGIIRSEWLQKDGSVSTADVSPLLMVEFGSGLRADNTRAREFGMGTGTFPGQTHAEDPGGWWYMDLDGKWHHSRGIEPSRPMFEAAKEMYNAIQRTASDVFWG